MNKYITSDPNILGGRPVIIGTRIPVDQIFFLLKNGFTMEAINEEYPQLTMKKISGTIDEATEMINNVSQTL